MTHLQLNDTVAAALRAQAEAQGLSIEAYLGTFVLSVRPQSSSRLSADEFERLLGEEATAGPSPAGTFSRSELYADHA
jgi:hypothetical protein